MKKDSKNNINKHGMTLIVNILHDLGISLQFNCFTGDFEIVDQDMNLDYAINNAIDKTKFNKE